MAVVEFAERGFADGGAARGQLKQEFKARVGIERTEGNVPGRAANGAKITNGRGLQFHRFFATGVDRKQTKAAVISVRKVFNFILLFYLPSSSRSALNLSR